MRSRLATLALCIGLCLIFSGCGTTVKVINFDESEYYETVKDGVKFHCMSDYYLQKVLNAKIQKVNPK